ncbi:periplasmic substrate-binding component of a lysine-arginine-ornithine transporter [Rahnella aquatilis CIP 78.65 = ATCC 33071]|uniref:Periplasmic component of amino acid ABC-type transporter/signal transduction system n=1 Tax=Rahnella aquatilis (strain ATCC 33071 / DSM 4594 / JCM 1683 / NBRC 105701 / NCIMB 13365 / CIP 78.65) TaxID=745277 RepID=H2IWF3_RAHAC|nr:ABC transporter substrate-binding protein [Rahnella aquatilis]AEX52948.1 periplasmic component of amino acid ABC-type transporter/signal transduction system [Rahnella aquatilis CIP 78.65 = ATCC 33071]KFD04865.1 periplasmic substrate-binding component of a lysine-arginine-ornithine transporter [Rahnella aquatilis CIP 78.65 = ATCC 33071]
MKKLKIALLLGCAVASFSALADGSTLKFGLEAQYPPFESKSATGELQGFDIDLGNAVCAAAGVKCDWYDTSFDGLIAALQARKFDAINSAMNVTDKRRQAIDFTHVIYRVPTKLIAKKDSGLLPATESLKGKHIGVLQGSIQESYAQAHWAPKGVDIVSYQDQNQVYLDLSSGRLDGTLVLAPAGQSGFLSRPDGKEYGFVGDAVRDDKILGSGIAFGLRKGDTQLKEKLDVAIAKVQKDGVVKALSKKYFGDIDVSVK